ncbi:branched-chain amino acid ABC transporter permease [Bradyrhizobium sp. NP1]|uniref:branched-chain amino acid ABC transporter permease n=1 Tax=Bradyrhizobium sp. NP1 TaxID=3049772 RepID=UPI0025A5F505|nr:branched-chain amino acid ABC transporter permease [Bradyrhizobium sp. NP1]WJR76585.1 branched-chain amino acid ABC transporter permease [Bradyrhizobium sp. NP1]
MIFFQYLANGLILGGLYACIAAGFSLVWGVLSIINLLHGSFIVFGFYIAYFSYTVLGIHPFLSIITSGLVLGAIGYVVQFFVINRVVARSVLVTLILTFGLELMMNNAMLVSFSADYRKVILQNSLGIAQFGNVFIPLDRALSTLIAFLLILLLWLVLRLTSIGRAIVAVRFDREAALLMGIDVTRTYAVTFALGAALAGAAGSLLSVSFPIAPLSGPLFLSKAFVICVLGGVGSVPGAAVGGLAFGLLESFGAVLFGSEYALTLAFVVLIILLLVRPHGLLGVKGF